MTGTVLSLKGITKRFGPLVANNAIDLDVKRGEIVALLGENGAGKTTLMNILFGHYVADEGEILIAGADGVLVPLPAGSPQAALAAGIGMVHQHFTLAENLTGFENIVLGTEPVFAWPGNRRAGRRHIEELMRDSGLNVDLDVQVSALTVGEKQRVEILKALYRDVRVLVLDEPTAVLTPQESEGLFGVVRKLAERGIAIIFISHKLHEVLAASHRIVVLRGGSKAGEMATAEADRHKIALMMVGSDVPPSKRDAAKRGDPIAVLEDVHVAGSTARQRLHGVSLKIHSGEIVGIAGVSGNGQAALAALFEGLSRPDEGRFSLFGEAVTRHTPRALMAKGVARIPEDRHHDGIVGTMTVAENIAIEDIRAPRFHSAGFVRRQALRARAQDAIAGHDVRCSGPDAPAQLLSGGNIQKLILARVLDRAPRLILANQPTRGLDVGAQTQIYRRLLEARGNGAAVLLISEDLDELFTLADRIAVIHAGELSDAFATEALDRTKVGLMMAGHDLRGAA